MSSPSPAALKRENLNTSIVDYEFLPTRVEGFSICPLQSHDFELLTDIAQGRVVPSTSSSVHNENVALTIEEMNQWKDALSLIESAPVPLVIDPNKSKPVFVAVLDGTWNDRDDKTLPIMVPGKLSYQLEEIGEQSSNLKVKYYHGVGTRVSWWQQLIEGVIGTGAKERAERALDDFREFAKTVDTMPHVYAIGFSRGAASARHFLQTVDKVIDGGPLSDISSLERSRSFA